MATDSQHTLQELRWFRPILGCLFVAVILLGATAFAASDRFQTTLFVVAIAVLIVLCVMFIDFAWKVFLHFVSNTDSALWLWVLLVLIVITTLGIAALLFALFLVFAYYPDELKRELEVALPEAELERQFQDITDKLEKISRQFVAETGSHVAKFSQECVDEAVLQSPLQANSLGHERLGILKREVAELISAVPSHVEGGSGAYEWPHRAKSSASVDDVGGSSIADLRGAIDDTISIVLGPVGAALVRNGFAKSGLIAKWVPQDKSEGMKYRDKIKWSPAMNARFDEYCSTYGELKRFQRALVAIRRSRERDEAKQLWESS